jgi:hypothetical protein
MAKFWRYQIDCHLVRSLQENARINCYMRTLIAIILWCILFVLCWPLALAMIFLLPIVWLILLPFRIVGFTLEVVFKFIGAILLFPFRLVKAI